MLRLDAHRNRVSKWEYDGTARAATRSLERMAARAPTLCKHNVGTPQNKCQGRAPADSLPLRKIPYFAILQSKFAPNARTLLEFQIGFDERAIVPKIPPRFATRPSTDLPDVTIYFTR